MPDSRISPKVIFCWRVVSGMLHGSADRTSRELGMVADIAPAP